jgi:hypothetical protein
VTARCDACGGDHVHGALAHSDLGCAVDVYHCMRAANDEREPSWRAVMWVLAVRDYRAAQSRRVTSRAPAAARAAEVL